MRWAFEKVDFEPGGKDHSSEGGSFTTAAQIVSQVYGANAPQYLQYEFVSIKGGSGKMSSSSGEVVTVDELLKIYSPEMIRWIFASYRSNVEFSIGLDLDVIKTYENFDRFERLALGFETGNPKKVAAAQRIYQLAMVDENFWPASLPFRPPLRHLTNILQINDGNIEKCRSFYADEIKSEEDEISYRERARRAAYWIEHYAPAEFRFQLNARPLELAMSGPQQSFIDKLVTFIERDWEQLKSDVELHEKIYAFIHQLNLEPKQVFSLLYQLLISQEKGPKLASFMGIIGRERLLFLLGRGSK